MGCGKSTLLRVVAGLEAITSGTMGGRLVIRLEPCERGRATVFLNYALSQLFARLSEDVLKVAITPN